MESIQLDADACPFPQGVLLFTYELAMVTKELLRQRLTQVCPHGARGRVIA
jgi:hypothetical protein